LLFIGQNTLLAFEKSEQTSGNYFLYSVQDTSTENHRTINFTYQFILCFGHIQREQPSASQKILCLHTFLSSSATLLAVLAALNSSPVATLLGQFITAHSPSSLR
jgi:hypothetical protein